MKKYTLTDKQMLMRDAIRRMDPLHQHWKVLEGVFRTGLRRDLNARDFADLTPTPIPGNVLKTINMTLPHLSLMATSIVSRDPQMLVTPIGGESEGAEDSSTFAQAVLFYFWKRTDATDDVKAATEDMLKLGNGFVKVGWDYMAEDSKSTPTENSNEIGDMLDSLEEYLPEMNDAETGGALTYSKVLVDDPYVEYVSPYDIFLPKDARRMESTRWVAQRLRLPISTLRERFGETKTISIDAAIASDALTTTYSNEPNNVPEILSYAVVYEFYDMQTRQLTVFQIDGSEILFDGPIPYQHRYPPFVHFRNYNDGGMQCWAFGDLENIAGIQLMLGEVTRAQIDDLKRSGNKYAIRKRHVTPELKKQLESPLPDQVVVLDIPETSSLDDVIKPLQRLATPSDAYTMDAKLNEAMRGVLGINDFQAGGVGSNRMSATAAAVVDGVATLRAQDKLAAVETGIAGIGQRILLLCQEFLDDNRAIRIAGPGGQMWLNVSASDIFGEFKVTVEGGSTRALNPATRAQRGIQTLQTVVPTLSNLGFDPTNAIRMALRDMGYDPNFLMVKKPEPTEQPMEAPLSPDMGMAAPDQATMDALMQMAQQPSPEQVNPADQVQQEFGGPGSPAATGGTIAL
jgi:hypothetical protein